MSAGASRVARECNARPVATRQALIDLVIDLVLGTPVPSLAQRAVEATSEALVQQRYGLVQVLLPDDLDVSESV